VYLKQGRYADAVSEFEKTSRLIAPKPAFRVWAIATAVAGRRTEALSILKELEDRYEKHEALGQDVAAVYVGLGDRIRRFHLAGKGSSDSRRYFPDGFSLEV